MIHDYGNFMWLARYAYRRTEYVDWKSALPVRLPAIFAANHPGSIDPAIIAAHILKKLKQPAFFIGTHKIGRVITSRFALSLFGIIVINQEKRRECLSQAMDYLGEGHSLVIFPGGKLDHGQELTLKMSQKGLAWLAHKSGLPVYPVGYLGPTNRNFMRFLAAVFGNQPVRLKFGKPLNFLKITGEIPEHLILVTTQKIIDQINELVRELKN
jgi:1-acyl-sn-glycerol-3-phosphate acyltransferase